MGDYFCSIFLNRSVEKLEKRGDIRACKTISSLFDLPMRILNGTRAFILLLLGVLFLGICCPPHCLVVLHAVPRTSVSAKL